MKFGPHCKRTDVRDEGLSFKIALRLLRAHNGSEPAVEFGSKRLRLLRNAMIADDANSTPPPPTADHRLHAVHWQAHATVLPAPRGPRPAALPHAARRA